MTNGYWVLYSGVGTDGGFGDYAPPYWNEEPETLGGDVVWFNSEETARDAVETLNKAASDRFYSTGVHDTYDGLFPTEYKTVYFEVPESIPTSRDHFDWLIDGLADTWETGYEPYGDGYECDEDCCREEGE